jgi:hypothetical protein
MDTEASSWAQAMYALLVLLPCSHSAAFRAHYPLSHLYDMCIFVPEMNIRRNYVDFSDIQQQKNDLRTAGHLLHIMKLLL